MSGVSFIQKKVIQKKLSTNIVTKKLSRRVIQIFKIKINPTLHQRNGPLIKKITVFQPHFIVKKLHYATIFPLLNHIICSTSYLVFAQHADKKDTHVYYYAIALVKWTIKIYFYKKRECQQLQHPIYDIAQCRLYP